MSSFHPANNLRSQTKAKKNVETDLIGDKVGRIHLGRQDLSGLQTRKMKGLKRSRDDVDVVGGAMEDELEVAEAASIPMDKKAKLVPA